MKAMNKVVWKSEESRWATPQALFDTLNLEFHFTLDPCADDMNHKCDRYYTEEQDGLLQDWTGETVFCNPPYGKCLKSWVEKCATEDATVVMLVPARTDTEWFHRWVYGKAEIRFIKGRLRFNGSKMGAPFPSMICVYRRKE
jgi:site-specific DNA-methyltransferase (adenine-specific)